MSIEHNIRAAKTPAEALMIVARAIDRIDATLLLLVHEKPADPWAEWGEPVREFSNMLDEARAHALEAVPQLPPTDVAAQVRAIEAMLAKEHDPEELQALGARLRLLKEDGQAFESPVQQGRRAGITSDGTNGQVELPPVSEERKQARRDWAHANDLHEYIPLDIHDAREAFAKGGPEWLYEGNRDAVMQLPFAARQWLVQEVSLDSQAAAQEMGRDILKSEESTDKNITLDAIDAMSGR